jgi:hypothetical protein
MKEKLRRLLRAVLDLVLRERGYRKEGTPPTSPPATPPRPEAPREDHRHG